MGVRQKTGRRKGKTADSPALSRPKKSDPPAKLPASVDARFTFRFLSKTSSRMFLPSTSI